MDTPRLLLSGHDTIACAYYLQPLKDCGIDFEALTVEREALRQAKRRDGKLLHLGGMALMLKPNGSSSGYPFVFTSPDYTIECGEFNNPSFFVTFHSLALWREGAFALHQRFMDWAHSLGFSAFKPEGLSRVDFTFDYHLTGIDFDEDSFVTLFSKDSKYRKDSAVQGFVFGSGDTLLLRIYDKVREIEEKSFKTWFYQIWGIDRDVWRVEWQVRKDLLRRFGLRTFADLKEGQGDLLRYVVNEHTTLRLKTADSNRTRWPLHPLWEDLQKVIADFEGQGVYREIDSAALLDEQMTRMAISLYGYMKRIGAIHCIQHDQDQVSVWQTMRRLEGLMAKVHDPLTWEIDVQKRIQEMRLKQW